MVKAANENNAPYAVMFTDMRMPPGWDGLKTAKKIREIDKNIEIVIMTAYADHDQDVIAREIGTPDKLFYIKKPFQAEEIFQLAMSLTAKWSSENLSRIHRSWLEKTLVCMRRARHFGKEYNAPYMATLESFLSFLNSNQGIIAEWDKDNSEWILKGRKNVEKAAAEEFFKKNAGRIQESSVIQSNVDEFYVIPLKNNEFSVSIGIQGAQTENDPEWYKLLNLLLTTSLEGLENSSIKAKKNFESTKTREMLALSREIYSDVEALEKKYNADKTIKTVLNKISKLLKFFKQKDLSDL
jgi:YesN/AraC family two-component response regulator